MTTQTFRSLPYQVSPYANRIFAADPTYADIQSGTAESFSANYGDFQPQNLWSGSGYQVIIGFARFDTTSMPGAITATLKAYCSVTDGVASAHPNEVLQVYAGAAAGAQITTGDWLTPTELAALTLVAELSYADMPKNSAADATFGDVALLANIAFGDYTDLVFVLKSYVDGETPPDTGFQFNACNVYPGHFENQDLGTYGVRLELTSAEVSQTFAVNVENAVATTPVSQTFGISVETNGAVSQTFPGIVESIFPDAALYGTSVAVHCIHGDALDVDHNISGSRIVFKDAKAIDAPAGDVSFDSMQIPEAGDPPVYSRVKNFHVTLPVKSGSTWDDPTMHFEARHRSWSGVRMFVTKSDAPVSTGPSVDGQPVDPLPGFVDNVGRYTAANPITLQPLQISQASLAQSEQYANDSAACYRVEFDDEFVYELIKASAMMFIRRISKSDLSVSGVSAALSLPAINDTYMTTHIVGGFMYVFGGDLLGGSAVVSKVSCSTLAEVGVLELNEAQYNGYVTSDGEYLYTIGFDDGAYESIITKISLSDLVQVDTLIVPVDSSEDDTANYGLAVWDGKLYAGTGGHLYAIDKETMTVLQKSATFSNGCGLSLKVGDYIYTAARGGVTCSVRKLAAEDLSLVDSMSFPGWDMHEPLFIEESGHLLFYDNFPEDGLFLRAVNLETMEAYAIPENGEVEFGNSFRMTYDPSHGLWFTSTVTSPSLGVRMALVDLDIHSKPLVGGPTEFWVQAQASVSSDAQPGYPRDFALVVRANEVGTSEVVWT